MMPEYSVSLISQRSIQPLIWVEICLRRYEAAISVLSTELMPTWDAKLRGKLSAAVLKRKAVCRSRRGSSPKHIAAFLSDEVHRPQCRRNRLITKPSLAEEIVRWFFWCCRASSVALARRSPSQTTLRQPAWLCCSRQTQLAMLLFGGQS